LDGVEKLPMRIPIAVAILAAAAAGLVVIVAGQALLTPDRPLILNAAFAPETISPNADGADDVTIFRYSLSRRAQVTISLTGEDGSLFYFRQNEPRAAGDYEVAFSGVVDGFVMPGEQFAGEVLRRLIPDGDYTWRLSAADTETGETAELSGVLRVQGGDAPLPDLTEFTVFPEVFTPNQDGVSDRTEINLFLTKPASLNVFLEREGIEPIYLSQRLDDIRPGEAGRHAYDYEGGVDLNADPPPDGEYSVVALAQDAVGQRVQRTAALTIQDGGKPFAQIVPQPIGVTVVFEAQPYDARYAAARQQPGERIAPPDDPNSLAQTPIMMPVGDLLVFKLTVENYSDVPIRTTGPEPGTVYDWEQRDSTLGWFVEAGAWRVGIDCTTAVSDYPWRWALGTADNLETGIDPVTGREYLYLPPGERSVVWGAVRMSQLEVLNPQNCWAGLIHEFVEVSNRNNNVGARQIFLVEAGN
jgi:hypothetical protein